MSTPSSSTNHDDQQFDKQIDPIISKLNDLVDELNETLADNLNRPDRRHILQGIAAAICVQEIARMTVTRCKMDAGIWSSIDAETLRSDWQVLCRHYAGAKHAKILDHGILQLEKLSPSQADEIIYTIRHSLEPSLNWAMEDKEVTIGFSLPVIGRLGIGNLRFNLRGSRVAIQSFGGRLIRLVVQVILWLVVTAGTIHWISWTFFDEPFLATTFNGLAKLAQFILLLATTLVVWVLAKVRQDDSDVQHGVFYRVASFAAWAIVAVGWCQFLIWLLLGISSEESSMEAGVKLLLPFFLVAGSIAAWISGRVFRQEKIDND